LVHAATSGRIAAVPLGVFRVFPVKVSLEFSLTRLGVLVPDQVAAALLTWRAKAATTRRLRRALARPGGAGRALTSGLRKLVVDPPAAGARRARLSLAPAAREAARLKARCVTKTNPAHIYYLFYRPNMAPAAREAARLKARCVAKTKPAVFYYLFFGPNLAPPAREAARLKARCVAKTKPAVFYYLFFGPNLAPPAREAARLKARCVNKTKPAIFYYPFYGPSDEVGRRVGNVLGSKGHDGRAVPCVLCAVYVCG
jgi:hypothetical protein